MPVNGMSGDGASQRAFAWPLELEVELCATNGCEATAEQLGSLTGLLSDAVGVSLATVEPHGQANLVRVRLTVDAFDPQDALDRVGPLVRDCVDRAGLGPAILVAARSAERRPAGGRRMG